MIDRIIGLTLILLLIFTPVAFGAMDLWAFSIMELGILFVVLLWALQWGIISKLRTPNSQLRNWNLILLGLFLCLILFQMIPLPSGLIKALSPQTYDLRHYLLKDIGLQPATFSLELLAKNFSLSLVPFSTRVEFFKWLTLIGLFLLLQCWNPPDKRRRWYIPFITAIFMMGVLESLYGMFEIFSGHKQALNIKLEDSSVAGTFISRNYFAGYLLMVIPLSIGFLLSREEFQSFRFRGWRNWLPSLHGKTLLIGFGAMVMILSLFFSASRMGITSLLFSFILIVILLRSVHGEKKMSRVPILILVLALFWAAWIGLDVTINRFFEVTESFEARWTMWMNTFRIVKDFPLLGSGLGTFAQVFPRYRTFHVIGLASHAENDFLQLASEAGLIGMGLLLILFVSFFYKALSGIRSISRGDPGRYIGIGGLVGILALMLHSTVEANIQIPANSFLYTFLFGLILRLPDSSHRESAHSHNGA
jgi:O-antigen ligase